MFLVCDRIPHKFAGQSIVVGESIHALPSGMAVAQRFGRDARTRQAGAAELNGGVDLDRPRLRTLQVVSRKRKQLGGLPRRVPVDSPQRRLQDSVEQDLLITRADIRQQASHLCKQVVPVGKQITLGQRMVAAGAITYRAASANV